MAARSRQSTPRASWRRCSARPGPRRTGGPRHRGAPAADTCHPKCHLRRRGTTARIRALSPTRGRRQCNRPRCSPNSPGGLPWVSPPSVPTVSPSGRPGTPSGSSKCHNGTSCSNSHRFRSGRMLHRSTSGSCVRQPNIHRCPSAASWCQAVHSPWSRRPSPSPLRDPRPLCATSTSPCPPRRPRPTKSTSPMRYRPQRNTRCR
mmetsp:Transcript_73101/g.143389  ORF Transcript_73101/g.143389 Transcript_73101/m.143389 type:complete len:204 (+) Transcript_73101:51-662(+)